MESATTQVSRIFALEIPDIIVIVIYFVFVMCVGIWVSSEYFGISSSQYVRVVPLNYEISFAETYKINCVSST